MRIDRGWSLRELSRQMALGSPCDARMHVSERTLRRVEDDGVVPTARVQFAIARAFGLLPSQIWGAARQTSEGRAS